MKLIYRFVGKVHRSGLKNDSLWEKVKEDKAQAIVDGITNLKSQCNCFQNSNETLLSDKCQDMIIDDKDNLTSDISTDSADLDIIAPLFIYYNLCPKFMFDFTQFFVDLLRNASPDILIQALNRIMVTGKQRGDKAIVEIAKKVLMRTENFLPLKMLTHNNWTQERCR